MNRPNKLLQAAEFFLFLDPQESDTVAFFPLSATIEDFTNSLHSKIVCHPEYATFSIVCEDNLDDTEDACKTRLAPVLENVKGRVGSKYKELNFTSMAIPPKEYDVVRAMFKGKPGFITQVNE